LMVSKASLDAINSDEDPRRVAEEWRVDIEKFEAVRAKYLLY
jgi:hypothetical protein